jgi:uncharacterized protein (TIGR02996 family)
MVFDRQMQLRLIRGILAEPDEDAPRLVYADWLQEQDELLGEVVRVQTELRGASLPRARRAELQRRERDLLDGLGFDREAIPEEEFHGIHWRRSDDWDYSVCGGLATLFLHGLRPVADGLPALLPEWIERFGWFFLRAGVYDSWEDRFELEDAGMRELLASPLMERCIGLDLHSVKRWYDAIEILAESPAAAGLLRLDLGDSSFDSGDLVSLSRSPWVSGLLDLDVGRNYLDERAVLALAGSGAMPELRRLRLGVTGGSAAGFAALAGSRRFPELISLDLSYNDLDREVVRVLAEESEPPHLVELDVSGCELLGDEEALMLIRSPRLGRLRRLNLSNAKVGAATVEALCATDRFFRCGELHLAGCSLSEESWAVLARSPHASLLLALGASSTGMTDDGARALAGSPHLKNLRKLNLSRCRIGPGGAEALTDSTAFPNLEELSLWGNPLGARGAAALAEWGRRHGEPSLRVDRVGLTAAGVEEMVRRGSLAGLVRLDLGDNPIGDEGLAALAGCPDLKELRHLEISGVGMTGAGARRLIESPHLPRELAVGVFDSPDLGDEARQALRGRFAEVWGQ